MAESISNRTNSGRDCTFCGEAEHYGWCAAMRAYCEKATTEGRPVPNPTVRHGVSEVYRDTMKRFPKTMALLARGDDAK